MTRVLGVDLGTRRIGLALSDSLRVIATPHGLIERSGDRLVDHRALVDVAREVGAERIVVGLPRSLSGRRGPAAKAAQMEIDALTRLAAEGEVPMRVEAFDERFTTVVAERALGDAGLRGPARRQVVDKVAAAVMLQSWLDGRRRR